MSQRIRWPPRSGHGLLFELFASDLKSGKWESQENCSRVWAEKHRGGWGGKQKGEPDLVSQAKCTSPKPIPYFEFNWSPKEARVEKIHRDENPPQSLFLFFVFAVVVFCFYGFFFCTVHNRKKSRTQSKETRDKETENPCCGPECHKTVDSVQCTESQWLVMKSWFPTRAE